MNCGFTRGLQEDLAQVDTVFKAGLQPWWHDVYVYYQQVQEDHTFTMLPALTIAALKYMGHDKKTCLSLTSIVKLFYFSNYIHERIRDDREGQEHNRDMQFSILIGDLFLGRVLRLLVDNRLDGLLKLFAGMMSDVNQGLVEKYQLGLNKIQVAEKTRLPLYTTAFVAAARLAGVDQQEEDRMKEMGYHAGMTVELCNQVDCREAARQHAEQAQTLFGQGVRRNELTGEYLFAILRELQEILCTLDQAAAI